METQSNQTSGGVYLFNPAINPEQLFEAVGACLSKAESLAVIAATSDLENYNTKIINNYLWALCDVICEAKLLYMKINFYPK